MGFLHRFYRNHVLWRFFTIGCCFSIFACATDTIKVGDSIKDGALIVSAGQKFVLGFFGPQESNSRYVGIWYCNDFNSANKSVVWVANRRTPISGTGGILTVAKDGGLVLKNVDGKMAWSSNVTALSKYSAAVLTDTGNLVLQDKEKVLWQSFYDPTDTCLSQMHVRFDLHGEERRFFTSWRTDTDPSPGNYAMGIDPRGSPQIVIWEGANRRWRSGYWNGIMFIGIPDVKVRYQTGFRLISENYTRVYFVYFPYDRSVLVKFRLSPNGVGLDEEWNEEQKGWRVGVAHPVDECDLYGHCGPFGICNEDKESTCRCLPGFVPYDSGLWSRRNWTGGCIRRTELQCEKGGKETDGFMRIKHVNLPDYVDYVGSENAAGCKKKCLQNCSCTAYAFVVGINCMIWTGDLVDVQQFVEGGKTVHIRLAQSELGSKSSNIFKIASLTLVLVVATLLAVVSMWLYVKRGRDCQGEDERPGNTLGIEEQPETGTDLTVLNLKDVCAATDNFAEENKLGRGGFGQVYKGTLPGGQEIAVKRLSRKSSQGSEEFKNEITLIAKLQHRNLVKLLGCCIQREERMLLYEYMPNKSLDFYIFDAERRAQLDWSKRFNIIEGIARGLLYLHRDSRLRIIHRDLKASNILLDEDMNPKISDFGMARIFGRNQNEASTMRVVGTYGYMAPEYAMEGLFSLKSDVYSFGVLLLEIITGQRNNSFRSDEYSNIVGYAWDLWESGRALELLDSWISEKCCQEEEEQVARCVQLGMLCVQDMAADRPNMQSVVMVLECEIVTLPMPKQPTFTSMRHAEEDDMSTHTADVCTKDVSITEVTGR